MFSDVLMMFSFTRWFGACLISITCKATLSHLSSGSQIITLNSTSKSANHFKKWVPTCSQTVHVVVNSLPLEKSSPINILGSWYPPTCHRATMFLISAPRPRNIWACSIATFIVMLISILTHLGCYTPPLWHPCWNIVPVLDPHLVKDIEAIESVQRFATKCVRIRPGRVLTVKIGSVCWIWQSWRQGRPS